MEEMILALEERLRLAMLRSDVDELDLLLSPKLLFTNHLGQLISKEQDLEAHRLKTFEFQSLTLSDTRLLLSGNVGIVSVEADIQGSYHGQASHGRFRFTRVWSLSNECWQVVAGHSCIISS